MINKLLISKNLEDNKIEHQTYNSRRLRQNVDDELIEKLVCFSKPDENGVFHLNKVRIMNAVEQLLLVLLGENGMTNRKITNFGGFCYTKDDRLIAEYVLVDPVKFVAESEYNAGQDKRVMIELHCLNSADCPAVKAIVYDPKNDKKDRYNIAVNYDRTGKELNAEAAIFAILASLKWVKNDIHAKNINKMVYDSILYDESTSEHDNCVFAVAVDSQTLLADKKDNILQKLGGNFKQLISQDISLPEPDQIAIAFGDMYGLKLLTGQIEKNLDPTAREHTLSKLYGAYNFCPERKRNQEEREIIEQMKTRVPSDMEIDDVVLDIATEIQKSTNLNFKFRDYMLKGPTGTGKTTMCVILGLLLDLPVVTFNCDPDTDQLALGMSIVPNAKTDETEEISLEQFLSTVPDSFEIECDPAQAYERITGEKKEDADNDDCIKALMKKWADVSSKQAQGFRYVYSNIAKAMKNGWIVEVQEPTVIQRPGVLTALNSLTDDCAKMDLPNGETIHRHPDAVMIYTTNLNCEGCYEMNQSQKSRFAQRTINLPEKDVVVKRLCESTGFDDIQVAKKMVEVYMLATNFAASRSITDGAIDFRALQAWATANMIFQHRIYENGVNQFIEKCTEDPTLKALFITNCLDTQFAPPSCESTERNAMKNLR